MSWLSTIGKDVAKVFSWLGSSKATAVIAAGESVVEDVFPAATSTINLINSWVAEILKEEALAAGAAQQTGSGATKAASVIASITPSVLAFAQQNGLPTQTAAQISTANNALVAFLNAIGEPTKTTA